MLQSAKVGQMLIELKEQTPHGEFKNRTRAALQGASNDTGERLMTLARHLPLLEQHQPDSQARQAADGRHGRQQTADGRTVGATVGLADCCRLLAVPCLAAAAPPADPRSTPAAHGCDGCPTISGADQHGNPLS